VKLSTIAAFSFLNKKSECLAVKYGLGTEASFVVGRSVHLEKCVYGKRSVIKRVGLHTFQSRFVECSVLGI
jgi:hypothetical protein